MNSYHQFLNFLKNRELNELYASVAMRALAISMISIFIPIYLLQLGYSLVAVFGFFLTLNITRVVFMVVAAKISSRIGFKHTMFLNAPFLIAFYLLLYTLDYHPLPLYFLAIILGIGSSLFWLGYHFDFATFSDHKTRGKQISIAKIFISVFAVLGPLAGGLILYFFGFHLLFIISSSLLFFSVVPLFFSKDVYQPFDFSLKKIFVKKKTRNALAYMGHGAENSVAAFVWPIFIFFSILNSYVLLGLVSTVALFFTLISTLIIGKISDIRRRLVLRTASISTSIIWILKIFVATTLHVFILDSLHGITRTMKEVPFDALSYDKANKRENIMQHIVFREIFLQVGRIVLYTILMMSASLVAGLLMGSGSSLLILFF